MTVLTGGQALVQSLIREGVRLVLGVPGDGQYEAVDALYGEPRIRYVSVRHEQAASYMADGYARAGGGIAGVFVVHGPGVLNAAAGMATANAVSSPMLVMTGTRHFQRRGSGEDRGEFLRELTTWSATAESPAQIPALVREAFRCMKTQRPGPTVLQIPGAVLAESAQVELVELEQDESPAPMAGLMERAASLLSRARQPLIWAGGGAIAADAARLIQALAERIQAPVVTTRSGKGAISDHHPLSLGLAELRYSPLRGWLEGCDLILAVGTRTDLSHFGVQVIQIDIEPEHLDRRQNVFGISGDARLALEDLYLALEGFRPHGNGLVGEIATLNAARFEPSRQLQPQGELMSAVRVAMPDDGVLVQGMNQMGYYSRNYYPVYAPRTYLTASSLATLGCAYPLALGAKLAHPDRAVVALCGDGGFLYNAQELATAAQYGIHAVAVVFNDNAYGNVYRAQMERFHGRTIGTQLQNPDFVQLADTFGVRGVRAHDAEELERALRDALDADAPALIEVPVGMMERQY